MNAQFQVRTLVRLVIVVVVCGITSAIIARPPADASDGYGVTAFVVADQMSAGTLTEGRSVSVEVADR